MGVGFSGGGGGGVDETGVLDGSVQPAESGRHAAELMKCYAILLRSVMCVMCVMCAWRG